MARELLHYRPVDELLEDCLNRIAELVSIAGDSDAPSRSLPQPLPVVGDVAHRAPHSLPRQDAIIEPRQEAPRRDPQCRVPARDEASCQVV